MRVALLLVAGLLHVSVPAAIPATAPESVLVVGVADSPPFAIREADGSWTGLGVELWRRIAADLDLDYELRAATLEELHDELAAGTIAAGLGALPVIPAATARHDFSQPYLTTGLGFAQRTRPGMSGHAFLGALLDPRLLMVVGTLTVSILVIGTIIAVIERRQHSTDFGGPLGRGVATGIWWAAVTMTTVGYGDATPKSTPGRFVALLWMFVGVVAVAIFTATVTSMLTLANMRGAIDHPGDLQRLRLAAVDGGAGSEYLTNHHFRFRACPDFETALQRLAAGEFDVLVGNRASLRYLIGLDWPGELEVASLVLERDAHAIGLPRDSRLRSAIDQALVRIIHEDSWRDVEARYLGRH